MVLSRVRSAPVRSAGDTESIGLALTMAVAAVLLGVSSTIRRPFAMILVLAALMAVSVGVLAPRAHFLGHLNLRAVMKVVSVGIGLEVLIGVFLSPLVAGDIRLAAGLLATGALGIYSLLLAGKWRGIVFVTVVICHAALTSCMLTAREPPLIDVHQFQQEASAALLEGHNPHELRYRNLYGPGSPYYSREVEDGDRLKFGFPYPPLSLLMAMPGYAIAGDYRYAALAAVAIAVVLIGFAGRREIGLGAALLVLFAPLTQHVLYWGWTEPFLVLTFVAVVFLAVRTAETTPIALGLLIATKQYAPLLLPPAVVLLQSVRNCVGWPRMALIPLAAATATALPFLVWDVESFLYSTVTVQKVAPFRIDSLSIPAVLVKAGQELGYAGVPELPAWVGFAFAAGVLGLTLLRAARTPAAFCGASATVFLVFFLFAKMAFLNYYFAVFAILACGVAVTGPETVKRRSVGARSNTLTTG
jgi:hypothetical protein